MSVAKISEVMDVFRGKESLGSEGVDWCISPLSRLLAMLDC